VSVHAITISQRLLCAASFLFSSSSNGTAGTAQIATRSVKIGHLAQQPQRPTYLLLALTPQELRTETS
jgi:hypothetical protein